MATYVMSDIHGEYEKYLSMLRQIDLKDQDTLYILGDVIDRGPDSVKLLFDLAGRSNVFCLMGNHELVATQMLRALLVEITEENYSTHLDSEKMKMLLAWQQNGGDSTIRQFRSLTPDDRDFLLGFMEEFEHYAVIDSGGRTFVLVHSGALVKGKRLSEHTPYQLTFDRADYSQNIYDDPSVFVVSGHTPTLGITGKAEIYHSCNNINVDCGAAYGGSLACLCLDDMTEFYV